jgi:hypothetical protein
VVNIQEVVAQSFDRVGLKSKLADLLVTGYALLNAVGCAYLWRYIE